MSEFTKITRLYTTYFELNGMTMAQVADLLGVSYSTLSNWRNGVTEPDEKTLLRLVANHDNPLVQRFALDALAAVLPEVFQPDAGLVQRLSSLYQQAAAHGVGSGLASQP